jgi:alpha-amylase
MLHAFNWRYGEITAQARAIAAAGYGAVLFPPPLYSDERGEAWWQRYQPKDYRVIRSWLGNKPELQQAIDALHGVGVRAIADIVFNHMANEKQQRPENPYAFPGDAELARYRTERDEFARDQLYGDLSTGLFSPWDFNPAGDIRNWFDREEVRERSLGNLPDLDLNDWVVEQQTTCLRALRQMGFAGFRIDAIKHLPEEHIKRVFETEELRGVQIFGEALTSNDNEENLFLWPLVASTGISYYDFPLHETLRRVFSPAGSMRELVDPTAYGQALAWNRAVTFSVTHDIPYNDGFRGQLLAPQDEYLANVYLLGRDGGVPLVFSDHNESVPAHGEDRDRWCEAWRRYDIVQMIRFHNAVHGLPLRPLYEADGFLVFARGDRGIVAINKTDAWHWPRLTTWGLQPGSYRCQLHQYEMQLDRDSIDLGIPPRQAQMWLWEG